MCWTDRAGRPSWSAMSSRVSIVCAGWVLMVISTASAQSQLPPGAWTCVEDEELITSDSGPSFWMGRRADLQGNTLAITGGLGGAGSVYVFVREADEWVEQAQIRPPEQPLTWACALDGDTLLVAAYTDAHAGFQSGSIYVYVREGAVWTQEAQLFASDPLPNDRFGYAVAIDGDSLIVGAPRSLTADPGRAYVFVRQGTTWTQQARLENAVPDGADEFGLDVALVGDVAAVGAAELDRDQGACFVFRRSGASWSQEAKLTVPGGLPGDYFGYGVDLGPEALAATSHEVNDAQGAVYIFGFDGAQWGLETTLQASGSEPNCRFGWSVSLDGQRLLSGAIRWDEVRPSSGVALLFEREGLEWHEKGRFVPSDPESGMIFGDAVAIDGDTVLVTASRDGSAGFRAGAGYVYSVFEGAASNFCAAQDSSAEVAARLALNGSASLAALDLTLTVVGGPGSTWGMFFYGFETAALPFGDGMLCISPFAPGLHRLAPVVATNEYGCAWHELVLSDLPPDLQPGSTLFYQYWFRDRVPTGSGFNLSDGLGITFAE